MDSGLLILRVVGLALVALVLLIVLRQERPELASLLSLAAGVAVFFLVADQLVAVIGMLRDLAAQANVHIAYLSTALRVIGVAYLAEFAAAVARDAGEGALAAKVEMAGKVLILVLALPVVGAIIELVLGMIA